MDIIKKFEPIFGVWYAEDFIGKGSYGRVYRIKREEFGDVYYSALKLISIPSDPSELRQLRYDGMDDLSISTYYDEMVKDISGEIRLMSKLRGNTNIVSYEDHQITAHADGVGYDILIRMELLTNLSEYMTTNQYSRADIIKLGMDICSALELCQTYNIIHRDIKPDNIFVSNTGAFKLGDFGVARQLERTHTNLSKKGTPAYMAPEVYTGGEYDSTVDIYSLGIVMYQLLNNSRLPFYPPAPMPTMPKDKEQANALRMRGEKLPPPANATGRLEEIILKACSFEMKDRYANSKQMRDDLATILYDEEMSQVIYSAGADALAAGSSLGIQKPKDGTINIFASFNEAKIAPQDDDKTRSLFAESPQLRPEDQTEVIVAEEKQQPATEHEERRPKKKTKRKGWLFAAAALAVAVIVAIVIVAVNPPKQAPNVPTGSQSGMTNTPSPTPTPTPAPTATNNNAELEAQRRRLAGRTVISAGDFHTVGVKTDGTVIAVGNNETGQCNVSNWRNIVSVGAGTFHTVGLKEDGTVVAVGDNCEGRCEVSDWRNIIAIAASSANTIGLKANGTVVATGDGQHGQCDVSGWRNIVAIASGHCHTVGLKSDGTVVAVGGGANDFGQCDVSDWRDIVAIAAGSYCTVGLKSDGTVIAVGEIGNANGYVEASANKYTGAYRVPGWNDIVAISARGVIFGLKANGTVVAIGKQYDASVWHDVIAISSGFVHTVGLRSDGTTVALGVAAISTYDYGQCNVSGWRDIGVK